MSEEIRVLYIDDNAHDRALVRDALEREHGGFVVTEAASRAEFEKLFETGTYEIVLSDFDILGFRGMQVLDAVRSKHPTVPVVIVTGTGSEEIAVAAMARGAADYVIKSPKHIRKLPVTLRGALERHRTKEERDHFFRLSLDLLCVGGYDGRFKQVNPAWESTLGWTMEEMLSTPFIEFVHPDDREATGQAMEAIAKGLTVHQFENRYRSKDGAYHWLWWNSFCMKAEQRIFSVARDITGRKRAEEMLLASLSEKELLLKEIHHRVRNNLQVISSLLSLESAATEDPRVQAVFDDTQRRIKAMALVHERLLESANLSGIEFWDFLAGLVDEMLKVHGRPEVTPSLDVEPIILGIDTAMPCGLIVDELLSNSLKYAFPEGRKGVLSISLHRLGDGRVDLSVGDDGVGLPPGSDIRSMSSMGMELVKSLAEQLGATIDSRAAKGTNFTFTFRA